MVLNAVLETLNNLILCYVTKVLKKVSELKYAK
jgi:hypothetical protein